ncbi:MAG: DUF4252 domain-containing protein [Aquaticitalea sp.]
MTSLIKHIVVGVVLVATLTSCNQDPSLQTYFVDNQEKSNFLSIDIPVTMLKIDESQLTDDQKEAYNSVQKLNMLAYKKKDATDADFDTEFAKVKTILDDEKYEELMRGGNSTDGKFIVKYIGEDDDIDEFILLGSSNEMGFAVVRILGDDMDANKLMSLSSVLEKSDFDDSQLNQVIDFFK